jgi:DNA/RNA endonuclease G (NUC1)
MEVDMQEVIFESQLLKDGHLYCPKEYAIPKASFKVIVSLPEEIATDSEIELSSVVDQSDEFLSQEELSYYMNLDEK